MNMSDDQTVINADTKSCTIVLVQGLGNGADGKSGSGHSNFGIIVNELLPVASVIVVSHFFFCVGIGAGASARSISLVHHHDRLMAALHQFLLPFSILIASNAEYIAPAGYSAPHDHGSYLAPPHFLQLMRYCVNNLLTNNTREQ